MSAEVITAIFAGVVGVVTIFFGRAYWHVFSGLIDDNKSDLKDLRDTVRKQRDRVDRLENKLHEKDLEIMQLEANLDNYVNSSQLLANENKNLRQQVAALEDENLQLRSTLDQIKPLNP